MGQFGRIESVDGLPSRSAFEKLTKKAMKFTDEGVKAPPKPKVDWKYRNC